MSKRAPESIRHMVSLATTDTATVQHLLDRAMVLDAAIADGVVPTDALQGHTVANLFYEPSTRTRASFELAAARLGARVINLDMAKSSSVKGETLLDTIRTLHAMGVGLFVVRHAGEGLLTGTVEALRGQRVALVSAGEGRADHPTQGLVDALALLQRFETLEGVEVAIVGDVAHSRVARSSAQVLQHLGARVRIAGPAALMPAAGEFSACRRCATLAEALDGVQVVMALRIQRERIERDSAPGEDRYFAEWGLTDARLDAHAPKALVMHPGPFNREVEIASPLADGPRSLILRQVALGIPVRMAVLEWMAQGLQA